MKNRKGNCSKINHLQNNRKLRIKMYTEYMVAPVSYKNKSLLRLDVLKL